MQTGSRVAAALVLSSLSLAAAGPFSLHPENPHYFVFRGKPTVLVTSAEHYGAVINGKFDFVTYLNELQRHGLNNTRIWVGPYREVPGNFGISSNTLAPEAADFVAPWPRSSNSPGGDGGNKFDLDSWNDAFFVRLKRFVQEAAKRDVVVEVNLFCPYYEDSMWKVSPLNSANNVQGVGNVPRTEVLTMKHADLIRVQDRFVRKIVSELKDFDNLYYEICNEPYFAGVTAEWQAHVAAVIREADSAPGRRHLISQNIANGSKEIDKPNEAVSIFNFHYSRPAESVRMNYGLERAIGNNETGFDGTADATYRVQGWEFLMAGGSLYNNLDYSFTVGHERGDYAYPETAPGGGSAELRAQLGRLRAFFAGMPFVKMRPSPEAVRVTVAEGAVVRVLAQPDRVYAAYVHHGKPVKGGKPKYVVDGTVRTAGAELEAPKGSYGVEWWMPASGKAVRSRVSHAGGTLRLTSPEYREDIALRVVRR
jgi:hypothetical protein